MPKQHLLKVTLGFMLISLITLIGLNKNKMFAKKNLEQRPVISKIGFEQAAREFVSLELIESQIAVTESALSHISFKLTAIRDLNSADLRYEFIHSEDIEVIEGTLIGDIQALNAGQSIVIDLKVKKFSKQSKKFIRLNIFGNKNGMPLRLSALAASRIEDSYEYQLREQQKQQQSSGNQKLSTPFDSSIFNPENIIK